MRSRSQPMPGGGATPSVDQVVAGALALFPRTAERALPCTRIALSADNFVPLAAESAAITAFFGASSLSPAKRPAADGPATAAVSIAAVADSSDSGSRSRTVGTGPEGRAANRGRSSGHLDNRNDGDGKDDYNPVAMETGVTGAGRSEEVRPAVS
ncbi:unnamed protein product, partial [Phaeothamnion confervicola]